MTARMPPLCQPDATVALGLRRQQRVSWPPRLAPQAGNSCILGLPRWGCPCGSRADSLKGAVAKETESARQHRKPLAIAAGVLIIEEMSAQVPYGVGLTIKAPAASGCFCQACSTCSGEGGSSTCSGEGGCATCSRVS